MSRFTIERISLRLRQFAANGCANRSGKILRRFRSRSVRVDAISDRRTATPPASTSAAINRNRSPRAYAHPDDGDSGET